MTTNKAKVLTSFPSSKAVAYELPIIQQGENYLISAQLLHRRLKVQTKFSTWFQRRAEKYGFEKNVDFFPDLGKTSSKGGRPNIDYYITIDLAKELSMLEENDIGRGFRRYFIQKEKEARGISQLPQERELFRGLKAKRINDRELYPYRDVLERSGYSRNANANRRYRYWMHFVKDGNALYVTKEFALHLYHQKRVFNNRAAMLASQPVLPLDFGSPLQLKGGVL